MVCHLIVSSEFILPNIENRTMWFSTAFISTESYKLERTRDYLNTYVYVGLLALYIRIPERCRFACHTILIFLLGGLVFFLLNNLGAPPRQKWALRHMKTGYRAAPYTHQLSKCIERIDCLIRLHRNKFKKKHSDSQIIFLSSYCQRPWT